MESPLRILWGAFVQTLLFLILLVLELSILYVFGGLSNNLMQVAVFFAALIGFLALIIESFRNKSWSFFLGVFVMFLGQCGLFLYSLQI